MSAAEAVPDVLSTSGSYRVVAELGRGGMGTVFLALAEGAGGFERKVAIKRMHPHLVKSQQAVDRFFNEARIASHVHHANVVGIQNMGGDGENVFLVLDYVDGDGLDVLVRRAYDQDEKAPVRVALRIIVDALAGLGAVHGATDPDGGPLGILHRDVSPQNVLVGRDGTTRLADFGLAKCRDSRVVTDSVYVVGKLLYSAPEYLRHEAVGRELDIYAMGITLWTALAGHEPLPDCAEAQLLHQVLTEGIPPLAQDGGRIAPELVEIVAKACAPERANRYQTAAEMLDAIECLGRRSEFIASQAEVAAFVERVAGPVLSVRRKKLAPQFDAARQRAAEPARTLTLRNLAPEAPPSASASTPGSKPVITDQQSWVRGPSVNRRAARTPASAVAATILMAVTGTALLFQGTLANRVEAPAAHGIARAALPRVPFGNGQEAVASPVPSPMSAPAGASQPAATPPAPIAFESLLMPAPAAVSTTDSPPPARLRNGMSGRSLTMPRAPEGRGLHVAQGRALSGTISVRNPYRN